MKFLKAVSVAALIAQVHGGQSELNPIRKVVTLLQSMQKKVQQEGKQEKELYEKFMCYCKTNGGDLSGTISAAEEKIPAVSSNIETAEAQLEQSKESLKQAQADRAAAKKAMQEATSLREKEAAAFAKVKADGDANVAAIAKAVTALEKGMVGSFVQTTAAFTLRHAVEESNLIAVDRQTVLAFLSQGTGYAPQSGEIVGILKELGDTMDANLHDAISQEKNGIQVYEGLMDAKKKEVHATTATVEAKTQRIGELGVAIVQMKDDLSETQSSLAEDNQFLAELKKGCATKTSEWEERSKTRAEELVALADTIKVLNDDDALELFKKTLPSGGASFVQTGVSALRERATSALASIQRARAKANAGDKPGLEMLSLILSGKKAASAGSFDKVIKMIDNMVDVLHREQIDDDSKKEYCGTQHDLADDKKKALARSVRQEENAIATTESAISTLTEEIATLETGIKSLDKSVADATYQRKAENAEYKQLMSSNTAAVEVLSFAKNRLNKFYNPKLYKPAPKTELSREDRIYKNMGNPDDLITTTAPGGIADTGAVAFAQLALEKKDAPAPPPETWGTYANKGQETNGVLAMIDLLIKDLDKDMTEASTDEKNAQAEYEQLMADAAKKRATDSEALTTKGTAKADMEGELQSHKEARGEAAKELMATEKYIASLHSECDWLMQYYDVRKEARAGEVDSLKNAKAVLSGASFSLVQRESHAFLRRAV